MFALMVLFGLATIAFVAVLGVAAAGILGKVLLLPFRLMLLPFKLLLLPLIAVALLVKFAFLFAIGAVLAALLIPLFVLALLLAAPVAIVAAVS